MLQNYWQSTQIKIYQTVGDVKKNFQYSGPELKRLKDKRFSAIKAWIDAHYQRHTTGQFFQILVLKQTQNGLQSRFTVKRF